MTFREIEKFNFSIGLKSIKIHSNDMPRFINLLQQIEEFLQINKANIYERLQPGLKRVYTEQLFNSTGIQSNNELLTLYEWRNGVNYNSGWVIGEIDFFSGGLLLSVEDMINAYKIFYQDGLRDNKALLPIFTDGSGDYLLYNDDKTTNHGQLLLYAPSLLLSAEPKATIYDSLTSLFKTIIECYNNRAYTFKNGQLEIDYDLEWEIAEALNPSSDYWKEKNIF